MSESVVVMVDNVDANVCKALGVLMQEDRNPTLVNLSSGAAAAVCATLVTQPADVIRTRMQLVAAKGTHIGPLKTLQVVIRTGGTKGLLVGTVPRVSLFLPCTCTRKLYRNEMLMLIHCGTRC